MSYEAWISTLIGALLCAIGWLLMRFVGRVDAGPTRQRSRRTRLMVAR
jgi:hypothetical protein